MKHVLCSPLLFWVAALSTSADEPPQTGPATESRFPPLQVPAGFKATLFACDPLIEYPSVISAGPRPGAIFVAVDYMTGLGTEIVRRSEVRLVEDTNGDGYADKATVFAGGFNSIMGLAWHGGTLYVMHAPLLTALRDTKGTGVADERKDIVSGLGLTPEENPVRLHCANGVTAGHDGWLYLALGDHGCVVQRPEGDRLVLEGGGILRCRPDGRDLHIFSNGLRNIYDVALDAELNVFVRDNENDGGDYKIRVCHSFFGADHGYPYLYYEDPAEALRPLADLGLGSAAGGVCYLERQFPPEYRGNLFFCEWGKSLVRYPLKAKASSFASSPEIEFAVGAADDPYGFKPTDVVVQRDGSLMVSDYADGQRPKRGRGRIYHIAHVEGAKQKVPPLADDPLVRLDSESYHERCDAQAAIERAGEGILKSLTAALVDKKIGTRGRLHAVWILVHLPGAKSLETLLAVAETDPEPAVRAQAVRAIADLADPILSQHRLNAGPGDAKLALRLASLAKGSDGRVALEVVVALGRLQWPGTADWLPQNIEQSDVALAHAAMQALRRADNWPAVLKLLDAPPDDPRRSIALRAVSRQYDTALVDGLLERLSRKAENVNRLQEYAAYLARVYKKPGPWVYWDYRPKPRPTNPVSWERTDVIAEALNGLLARPDSRLRLTALEQMQREKIPADLEPLGKWLQSSTNNEHVAVILENLRGRPAADVHRYLVPVISQRLNSSANRLAALALYAQGIDAEQAGELLTLCESLEEGPVLADALRLVSKYPKLASGALLVSKLTSKSPDVRAAAIHSLGELRAEAVRGALAKLFTDQDADVRRAAAEAAGKLNERPASEGLLKLATDGNGLVRAASLKTLHQFKESLAVPLAVTALEDRHTDLIALNLLRELGGPHHAGPLVVLARNNPALEILTGSAQTLTEWRKPATPAQQKELDQAVAEIQGASGSLLRWWVSEPMNLPENVDALAGDTNHWRLMLATGLEGRLRLETKGAEKGTWILAQTDIAVAQETDVEFLAAGGDRFEIWLNGKSVHERKQPPNNRTDSDRISAALVKGTNQLNVALLVDVPPTPIDFQMRFRRKSATAAREKLAAAALARAGNVQRGRAVFLDAEKSLCLKCHRLNDLGEKIGPELTGLGTRFSRIHIVESILDPSRSLAPSYGTLVLLLENGQVLSGIKIAEDEATLTLFDNQRQKHLVKKDNIQEQKTSAVSTMPEGLETKLSADEFVDLVAFLVSQVARTSP